MAVALHWKLTLLPGVATRATLAAPIPEPSRNINPALAHGSVLVRLVSSVINVALPRVRDFRGLNPKSFDGRGNYSLGIKEHIIFPEIDFDKMGETWGMDITVCTTAASDDEARALLTAFNFPFRQ